MFVQVSMGLALETGSQACASLMDLGSGVVTPPFQHVSHACPILSPAGNIQVVIFHCPPAVRLC